MMYLTPYPLLSYQHPSLSSLFTHSLYILFPRNKVNVLCCAALPLPEEGGDEFVMGMANGQLGVVGRGERTASRFVDVQKGALTSLWVVFLPKNEEGQLFKLVTGGTNGFIKVLDQSFEPLAEFNLYRLPEMYGNLHPLGKVRGVKSICVDRFNRKILYGTAGGEIGEMDLESGVDLNRGPLVRSHFRDELHSVCPHPLRQVGVLPLTVTYCYYYPFVPHSNTPFYPIVILTNIKTSPASRPLQPPFVHCSCV